MDKVSFLPEDYQKKRLHRRTNLISIGLFTVVMAAIVMAFAVTDRQRAQVREQYQEVNEQFAEAARRLEQFDELQGRKRQIIRKANVTAVLVERVPRSLILAELINLMPAEVSLLELKLETKKATVPRGSRTALDKAKDKKKEADQANSDNGPELPKIPPTEATIYMIGVAETDVQVAQYMQALGRSPMFMELNLVFSQEDTVGKRDLRRFRVDMKLNQQVNAHDIKPLRKRRGLEPSSAQVAPVADSPDQLSSVDTAPPPAASGSSRD